jgi:hypothetical protein
MTSRATIQRARVDAGWPQCSRSRPADQFVASDAAAMPAESRLHDGRRRVHMGRCGLDRFMDLSWVGRVVGA